MGVEIERKFLVNAELWQNVDKPKGTPFVQGYILSEDSRTVRVRATDQKGYITLKGKSTGFSRSEYEYEIPAGEAHELISNFAQSSIKKTRYCIEFAGKTWEVDEFEASNEGLLVAEIELEAEDEQFDLPPWLGKEVTDDERYYNAYLSVHPFKQWA
ncbi:CYTH domain-containing protein [Mucilaginibacter sp.]